MKRHPSKKSPICRHCRDGHAKPCLGNDCRCICKRPLTVPEEVLLKLYRVYGPALCQQDYITVSS